MSFWVGPGKRGSFFERSATNLIHMATSLHKFIEEMPERDDSENGSLEEEDASMVAYPNSDGSSGGPERSPRPIASVKRGLMPKYGCRSGNRFQSLRRTCTDGSKPWAPLCCHESQTRESGHLRCESHLLHGFCQSTSCGDDFGLLDTDGTLALKGEGHKSVLHFPWGLETIIHHS